jgi:hypothetical protein
MAERAGRPGRSLPRSRKRRDLSLARTSASASAKAPARLAEAQRLHALARSIKASGSSWSEKLRSLLASDASASTFEASDADPRVLSSLNRCDDRSRYLLLSAVAAGQLHLFQPPESASQAEIDSKLSALIERLALMEQFYDIVGGVLGYQATALELMHAAVHANGELAAADDDGKSYTNGDSDATQASSDVLERLAIHVPRGRNLEEEPMLANEATRWGISALPQMAEIYPLGGAGDRLGLQSEETGESLPVALLEYDGKSLLEGLVRDLEAREWLYYKLFREQVTTPVAIMTSEAKRNHEHITALCNSKKWFHRGSDSFYLFQQPLVPVLCLHNEGEWHMDAPLEPSVKPGGHGALWKLMHDGGVFLWLRHTMSRSASIVRQISNPIAGMDNTLLSLAGVGVREGRSFGFVSCERNSGASEGANVLVEREQDDGSYEYAVSNIEYTEFQRYGMTDEGNGNGNGISHYPANTNVLFASLEHVQDAVQSSNPHGALPGMLVNLGSKAKAYTWDGTLTRAGRLECSMQNIADVLTTKSPERLSEEALDRLNTFLVYNRRRKATSSAKRQRELGSTKLAQTPDGSFRDYVHNSLEALRHGGWSVPDVNGPDEYANSGPGVIAVLHPALGPLWSVISQKLRRGRLREGSLLRLELPEADIESLDVNGSLRLEADCPLGSTEDEASTSGAAREERLRFSDANCAKVRMKDVKVSNTGVDWRDKSNCFWKDRTAERECCRVRLENNAELDAEGVTLSGNVDVVVRSGTRLVVRQGRVGMPEWKYEDLNANELLKTWRWEYTFTESDDIALTRKEITAEETRRK